MPTLSSMDGGPITHGRAHHDGHRVELDRHRAHAGRARSDRLPHGARRRDPQRPAVDGRRADVRRSHPPRRRPAVPPFLGQAVPVVSPVELQGRRSPRPTCAGRSRSAGGPPRRSRSRSASSCSAGERFVYAYYGGIDKIAHERGFGDVLRGRAARRRPDGRRRASKRCRPAPPLLVTADHGQVDVGRTSCITPSAELLRRVAHAVGRGPVPLAPRPARREPAICSPRPTAELGDVGVGRDPRADARRALVRADDARPPSRHDSVTSRSSPTNRCSFYDPADSGPFELVCRHGSLTSAEVTFR